MLEIVKNISWLGHDSYCIKAAGRTIYIDPFEIGQNLPAADIILVSHDHRDHCSVEDIKKIVKTGTVFITEPQSALKLSGDIREMKPGDSLNIGGVEVEAVPAYNTNKKFHPKKNNWLGFILEVGGVRIYHAGDTDHIPEMTDFVADIALLPVSGTYVMTAAEAAMAAIDINPKIAIPMHYGSIVGEENDAVKFSEALAGKINVEILEKSKTVGSSSLIHS